MPDKIGGIGEVPIVKKQKIAVFKIGDQPNGYKNGELVEVIDLDEQIDGFVISESMKKIFYCKEVNEEDKELFRTKYRTVAEDGKATQAKVNLDIAKFTTKELADYTDPKKVIEITPLDKTKIAIDTTVINPKLKDLNSISAGSATYGSGGTYATRDIAYADLANLTGDLTFTAVSALTETGQPIININLGGYILTDDGANYLSSANHDGHSIALTVGNGTLCVENQNMKRVATPVSNNRAFVVDYSVTSAATCIVKNSYFDCNGYIGYSLRTTDANVRWEVYNAICVDGTKGISIDVNNTGTIIEGATAYGAGTGIDMSTCAGKLIDCSTVGCTTGYANTASLSTFSKCASSDATGSETALQNLVAGTVFQSTTSTDANFLYPVEGQALNGAGVNPTISGHTTYYNSVAIVTDDVDIGANGLVRASGGGNGSLSASGNMLAITTDL